MKESNQPALLEMPAKERRSKPQFNPKEFKIQSLRECPTPAEMQLCDTPDKAADYWRNHVVTHPYFNRDVECLVILLVNTRRKIQDHVLVSTGTLTDAQDGWNRADWEQDYTAKMTGTEVVREAVALARLAFKRFEKFCEEFATEIEATEIALCDSLCLLFRPSIAVATIRSAHAAAAHRCPDSEFCGWGQDPAHFIGWLQPKTPSK